MPWWRVPIIDSETGERIGKLDMEASTAMVAKATLENILEQDYYSDPTYHDQEAGRPYRIVPRRHPSPLRE